MKTSKYLYSLGYDDSESELCKLESTSIFNEVEKNKLIFSDIKIKPSSSAFIKSRIDIISYSQDYLSLIDNIKSERICTEGFKVEYIVFDGDTTVYPERLQKLRDIGYSIEGQSNYYNPTTTYALCHRDGIWFFGILVKNGYDWYKHKQKPCSYSNSISMPIAKALANIAAKGCKESKLIDVCCGVGTVMLEACFAGYSIVGCDINWKLCENARDNLSYFDYKAIVHTSDIKDIDKKYDAAIIDLPYNLLSIVTDDDILHIIRAAADITDRIIIVSTTDISQVISKVGLNIIDCCSIGKRGKTKFSRKIWVCEKRF
jgi:tRNA (guanine10-N2)-dimethyltransferase